MSYAPVLNDIMEVTVYCTLGGQTSYQRLHAIVTNVVGGGTLDTELAIYFDNLLRAFYLPIIPTQATFYGVSAQKIWPIVRTPLANSGIPGTIGTGSAVPLPTQTCGLGSFQTAFAGRAFRGRTYIPFPDDGHNQAPGEPNAAYITAIQNIVGSMKISPFTVTAGLVSTTYSAGVYHRSSRTVTPFTGWTVSSKWATQRKRGAFGRLNAPPF